ncbi:glycoside hydrolase family 81 protein [Coniella lustricola]|uniref:glucan endo-1,3-beta-D-glucosidase n=1 Tax=Coniella lustricola TaxID=2025994 RepID=A0A2T2ZTA7_9PEZI|nr:glycoside hydrolase family 81 protein [Coniella lustricola]
MQFSPWRSTTSHLSQTRSPVPDSLPAAIMRWYLLLTALQQLLCEANPLPPPSLRQALAQVQAGSGSGSGSHAHQHFHVNNHKARATVTAVVVAAAAREVLVVPAVYTTVDGEIVEGPVLETTVSVLTTTVSSDVVQVLPTPTITPDTTGQIHTQLESSGQGQVNPLLTNCIPSPTSLLPTYSTTMVVKNMTNTTATASPNIFEPIATDAPPSQFGQTNDHPVPRLGIRQSAPISTNSFFQNFFLGSQGSATFLHPYSVAWAKGQGEAKSWGLAVSHIDASQRALGPVNAYGAVDYFVNPIGIQSLILSAAELGSSTNLTSTNITDMSVVIQLRPSASSVPAIEFPLVQGSGFVTAVYQNSIPEIDTGIFFLNVTKVATQPRPGVTKYRINLEDGKTWYLYATSTNGSSLDLQVINNGLMRATSTFSGTIQVAKDPSGAGEALYDAACGSYAKNVTVSGSVKGMVGSYTLRFAKAGLTGRPLLMFALPHHVQSFNNATNSSLQSSLQLQTTSKGMAVAIVADSWTMVEPRLPVGMTFLPWSPVQGNMRKLSPAAKAQILATAQSELSQNMSLQTNLTSMYYSGKALAKFAMILAVVNDMLGDSGLAAAGLAQLKQAFALFVNNTQIYPLVYESAWGGIVSTATYETGDSGADFGNTYYNDHHFHYGYHVLTAAAIAHIDPSWLAEGQNRAWVNSLIRDYANPSATDPYFPVSRMFDWYHGHSFAHGLYESADGRDQESSSEDTMAAYALKMWGLVSGDANTAARGNLMLAVLARSLNHYFLYTSDNNNTKTEVEPADFTPNRVAGILFENKIDHTTYFGTNIEYIQGIHMLPLLPSTKYVRRADFVREEWAQYFSDGRADSVVGGWRGILYGNLATVQPGQAWDWFSRDGFDPSWLDGGASLTWYMAYSAALAGL